MKNILALLILLSLNSQLIFGLDKLGTHPDLLPVEIKSIASFLNGPFSAKASYASQSLTKPTAETGVVSTDGYIISYLRGTSEIRVALDKRTKTSKQLDCIRLNFMRKNRFNEDFTANLKIRKTSTRSFKATIPAQKIKISDIGAEQFMVIKGEIDISFYNRKPHITTNLYILFYRKSSCIINGKKRIIYLIDDTINQKYNDTIDLAVRSYEVANTDNPEQSNKFTRVYIPQAEDKTIDLSPSGDIVVFANEAGNFIEPLIWGFVNKPMLIDGCWFTIRPSSSGSRALARKFRMRDSAQFTVPYDNWSAILVGKKNPLCLYGGQAPITIPKDDYVVVNLVTYDKGGNSLSFGRNQLNAINPKVLSATSKTPIELTIGKQTSLKNLTTKMEYYGAFLVCGVGKYSGIMSDSLDINKEKIKCQIKNTKGKIVFSKYCKFQYNSKNKYTTCFRFNKNQLGKEFMVKFIPDNKAIKAIEFKIKAPLRPEGIRKNNIIFINK